MERQLLSTTAFSNSNFNGIGKTSWLSKPGGKILIIGAIVAILAGVTFKYDLLGQVTEKAVQQKAETAIAAAAPVETLGSVTSSNSDSLSLSLVSFHGYAPIIVANGNSMTTKPGSINANNGLDLKIVIQDDVPSLNTIFEAQTAQCVSRTIDFWAQEHPNLRQAKHDGKAVMIVDNSQGSDAIITKDPSIKTVEDLAGKTVALLQFTPSHGMLTDAVENSSLSGKKKASVKPVFINVDEGTGGVRAAFDSGKVDAAVLWDPDLSLALRGGGRVVYSTKSATNLIYDVMVCDQRTLNDPAGRRAIGKFVKGWMQGVQAARANEEVAAQALIANEKMYTQLAASESPAFIKGLFKNVIWTDVGDNARVMGLAPGGTDSYARIYKQFDAIYRAAGALANPNSPVINPADSVDTSFIKALLDADKQAQEVAQATPTFTAPAATATAALTKPVMINFESGSSELTAKSKKTIDTEMVPFMENNASAYIELSGNADSVGSAGVNKALSLARAKTVADYLVKQWEIPAARFKVTGNGSDKPICNESDPEADGVTLAVCRGMNRTTRVGVLR